MRKSVRIFGVVAALCLAFAMCACGGTPKEPTPPAKTVTGIAVKQTQTDYTVGDVFGGGKITVTYDDGSTADTDMTASMLTGFDTSAEGVKNVTVSYQGKTANFTITVSAPFEIPVETGFDLDAALADTADDKWGGTSEQTVFDGENKFLTFREKSNASVAYLQKGMQGGVIEMLMKVDVRTDTTANVTFYNRANNPSAFCYAPGGKNYSLEFSNDESKGATMRVKKWLNGVGTALTGEKSSAKVPIQLSGNFTKVKIEVTEETSSVHIVVTVGTTKTLDVTDASDPILGGGAVGFSYLGSGAMIVGGKNSDAKAYTAPPALKTPVYEQPNVAVATEDVNLLADFDANWKGRTRIFNPVKGEDGSVTLASKDNPEEPQAGVTELQALYKGNIFGDIQLEYTFNVISQGQWIMFWFRCVPQESDDVSIWGNKQSGERTNSYSVLIDPAGTVQFHKWTGTTQIFMNGMGTKLPGSATSMLSDPKQVNTVKMSIEKRTISERDAIELRFQLNGSNILTVQDTEEVVFTHAGYVGLQGYATNNGSCSIRLLTAVAKQNLDLF